MRLFDATGSKTSLGPANIGAATVATVDGQIDTPIQTTPAAHTGVIAATIPLPGTPGADATRGLCTINVEVEMQSTTTADAAYFKLTWAQSVQAVGAPVALGQVITGPSPTGGIGTAAGGVPPAGWLATLQLDGTSHNVQVAINGDPALTVTCKVLRQVGYTN
jgi:hypothetical protein